MHCKTYIRDVDFTAEASNGEQDLHRLRSGGRGGPAYRNEPLDAQAMAPYGQARSLQNRFPSCGEPFGTAGTTSAKEGFVIEHFIFGLIDPRTHRVFHVGCARDLKSKLASAPKALAIRMAEIAPDTPQFVILQTVESHPLAGWVKWCKRLRRDLVTHDWAMHTALADAFTNSNRLKRALGEDVPSAVEYQTKFHEFDRENSALFDEMLRVARQAKAEGRGVIGMDYIVNAMRWDGADTTRTDRYKINDSHRAFYARKLQMVDPSLCGLFAMRESFADDLVLEDGRSWRDFAKEHVGELRFARPTDEDEGDAEWEY